MEGRGHLQTLNGLTKDASELHYGKCNIVKLSLHTTLVWLWNFGDLHLLSSVQQLIYVYWVYSIGISVGDSQGDNVVTSQACTMLYVQYLEYYY